MTGSVLIVGGGIAGRAVARVLARHGLGCTVIERRESVGRGMGVNLPGNAVRALGELGVPTEALAGGVPVRRREYRNGRGRLLFAVDEDRFWREVARPSACATATCSTRSHCPRRPRSSTRVPWRPDRRRRASRSNWRERRRRAASTS